MTPQTASTSLDSMSEQLVEMLRQHDPDVARILAAEADRQATTIELIASENPVSAAVMHAMGNWMTNKYAEGYPGARYYGGCIHHDEIENLALHGHQPTLFEPPNTLKFSSAIGDLNVLPFRGFQSTAGGLNQLAIPERVDLVALQFGVLAGGG